MQLPDIALSVRQPWAWAIVHAGKDIENRTEFSVRMMAKMAPLVGRRAIHASKGMTRDEYESTAEFMADLGVTCPSPDKLLRGGVIGSVDVTGVVKKSTSRWFFGPRGLELANPAPCDFIPSVGALGLFRWKPADPSIVPPPARWMLPKAEPVADRTADLFGVTS